MACYFLRWNVYMELILVYIGNSDEIMALDE